MLFKERMKLKDIFGRKEKKPQNLRAFSPFDQKYPSASVSLWITFISKKYMKRTQMPEVNRVGTIQGLQMSLKIASSTSRAK
jgi:hypothetical protein